jgi:hypothetical protein
LTHGKVFGAFFNKSDIYIAIESERGISCRERKPGECCEQKRKEEKAF